MSDTICAQTPSGKVCFVACPAGAPCECWDALGHAVSVELLNGVRMQWPTHPASETKDPTP